MSDERFKKTAVIKLSVLHFDLYFLSSIPNIHFTVVCVLSEPQWVRKES